jgi:hypothetical protein
MGSELDQAKAKAAMALEVAVDKVVKPLEAYVLVFAGHIGHAPGGMFMRMVRKEAKAPNAVFVLTTLGGYPDPAYRMMRCLQDRYKRITAIIPSYCKSAGTLMAMGAHELILADDAHLGPLDTQVGKYDEVGEEDSGLTPIQALNTLRQQMFEAFEHHFINVRIENDFQLTSRTCADIAARLTIGSVGRIYSQIDPMRLGDLQRAMLIAHDYGERLSTDNVKPEALKKLVAGYPSHSFVIDRKEATNLFRLVRAPSEDERGLLNLLHPFIHAPRKPNEAVMRYCAGTTPSLARTIAGGPNDKKAATKPVARRNGKGTREQDSGKAVGVGEPKPLRPGGQPTGRATGNGRSHRAAGV